ncbi:hypothetical protein PYJP_08180 [Pyrofollis japonicus]|uniref:NAD(P)-dependent oxidoreductase n=1 Tax=Pyrofollis japonicus TaxID=3060460 RepID=UPI00295A9A99|nr:NAD(P)-dependent oxidoreductase [Pyrofollis japonicus]BEP17466.1 hypothetical protein PYJP_08180 [Pyrofollis japonicus]
MINYAKRNPIKEKSAIILIYHFSKRSKYFLKVLSENNLVIERIIPIPYSAQKSVIDELSNEYNVTLVSSLDDIPRVALKALEDAVKRYDKVVLLEIGGYCAECINKFASSNLKGVVECTAQGHWRYGREQLMLPVISTAKAMLNLAHYPAIALDVLQVLNQVLGEVFYDTLAGKIVGILGYGNLGKACVRVLQGYPCKVLTYDIEPIRRIEAFLDGYYVDKEELLKNADIIIGATGNYSIRGTEFLKLKDGVILASATSRQVEFDIDSLNSITKEKTNINSLVTLYRLNNNKKIYLLNDGYPINFKHMYLGALEDLLFTMHYEAVRILLENDWSPGLHELPYDSMNNIAKTWLRYYVEKNK